MNPEQTLKICAVEVQNVRVNFKQCVPGSARRVGVRLGFTKSDFQFIPGDIFVGTHPVKWEAPL